MSIQNSDTDLLVLKAQKGDTEAFAQIYDALVKPIYRYIYYKVPEAIAEDLTEETFFKAWQSLKSYKKSKHPFSSWVFRIAHNLVVDHYRKHKMVEAIDETMADPHESNNPKQQAELKLTQIRLRKVIRQLPENYQQVIILKYINEMENPEIASIIGKTEGAVRTLQFRALAQLRTFLTEKEENH